MAPPEDIAQWNKEVVEVIVKQILENKGNVVIHCRGGVGRAGLLACNILSTLFKFNKFGNVIDFVRKRRDRRCVESRKQEDFVEAFFKYINQIWLIDFVW